MTLDLPLPLHFATFPVVCLGMRLWSSCCLHRLFWSLTVGGTDCPLLLGGRTAWSSSVKLQGRTFAARYWYDGQYVNNAREDAAEVALFILDPENHQARATTTYPGQLWPQQNTSFQQQRSYWSVSFFKGGYFCLFYLSSSSSSSFSSFSFRGAKLPYFLFSSFLSHFFFLSFFLSRFLPS